MSMYMYDIPVLDKSGFWVSSLDFRHVLFNRYTNLGLFLIEYKLCEQLVIIETFKVIRRRSV